MNRDILHPIATVMNFIDDASDWRSLVAVTRQLDAISFVVNTVDMDEWLRDQELPSATPQERADAITAWVEARLDPEFRFRISGVSGVDAPRHCYSLYFSAARLMLPSTIVDFIDDKHGYYTPKPPAKSREAAS